MNICIFEDNKANNFYPLSLTKPVFDLLCGTTTFEKRIFSFTPKASKYFYCRPYLHPLLKQQKRKLLQKPTSLASCLFINGRVAMTPALMKKISTAKSDKLFYHKKTLIAAFLTKDNLNLITADSELTLKTNRLPKIQVNAILPNFIWELVNINAKQIRLDAKDFFELGSIQGKLYENVTLLNKKNIFIHQTVRIKPGVVIDAEKGPVIIDQGCTILPNTTIIGPVYIGSKSTINAGAKILSDTSIGPVSKIGGEIAESIILGYSNKQHDGFLGHSYLGSWCNLGANTNNSDLKNNYGNIDIILDGVKINSKQQFAGLYMGDHSKTGINTSFNTGTTVGVGCNIFGSGLPQKFIPSFMWINPAEKPQIHVFDKFVKTASQAMKRRSVLYSAADKRIHSYIFRIRHK